MLQQTGVKKRYRKIVGLSKVVLNRDELNNKLLLAKDDQEKTAFHHASFNGNVQILERIWKWANKQLAKKKLNELLLAQDKKIEPPGT